MKKFSVTELYNAIFVAGEYPQSTLFILLIILLKGVYSLKLATNRYHKNTSSLRLPCAFKHLNRDLLSLKRKNHTQTIISPTEDMEIHYLKV